jgi:hypothetical protein
MEYAPPLSHASRPSTILNRLEMTSDLNGSYDVSDDEERGPHSLLRWFQWVQIFPADWTLPVVVILRSMLVMRNLEQPNSETEPKRLHELQHCRDKNYPFSWKHQGHQQKKRQGGSWSSWMTFTREKKPPQAMEGTPSIPKGSNEPRCETKIHQHDSIKSSRVDQRGRRRQSIQQLSNSRYKQHPAADTLNHVDDADDNDTCICPKEGSIECILATSSLEM